MMIQKMNYFDQVQEIQRLMVEGGANAIMTALESVKIVQESMLVVNHLFDY